MCKPQRQVQRSPQKDGRISDEVTIRPPDISFHVIRGLPCSPLASACFEQSMDFAVRTMGALVVVEVTFFGAGRGVIGRCCGCLGLRQSWAGKRYCNDQRWRETDETPNFPLEGVTAQN